MRQLDCDPHYQSNSATSNMRKFLAKMPDGTFLVDRAIEKLDRVMLSTPNRDTIKRKLNKACKMGLVERNGRDDPIYQKTGK